MVSLLLAHIAALHRGGTPVDPYWANVVSLLHFDAPDGTLAITDVVPGRVWTRRNTTGTSGVAQISTAQLKFGTASLRHTERDFYYDTPGFIPDATGATPITLEMFARIDALDGPYANRHSLCSQEKGGGASEQALYIGYDPGDQGKLVFYESTSFSGGGILLKTSMAVAALTWNHFAFDYDGTTIRLFVNGVLGAKIARSFGWGKTSTTFKLAESFVAGYETYRQGSNVFIDEFRATVGVSRYGSDVGFTPPTAPFPTG